MLAVLIAAVLGAAGAPAVTLFTTPAHTTRVTIGGTGTGTGTDFRMTTSGQTFEACWDFTLGYAVTQNAADVSANVTHGHFECAPDALVPTLATPWRVTISDGATTLGATRVWRASLSNVAYHYFFTFWHGDLTSNVTAVEPVVATAPICLQFKASASLFATAFGGMNIDSTFCFTGPAASWSLT
jgi:hypothetical protein